MADKIKVFMKNKNNRIFAVILILGIMLMLIPGGDDKSENNNTLEENRIEKILKSAKDVGDVEVYISYDEEKGFSSSDKTAVSAVVVVEKYNSYVSRTVAEVVSNITGIPVHKVMILEKQK